MLNKFKIFIITFICIYTLYYLYNSLIFNNEGTYVGQNFTKNIDSIRILPNGVYERFIYNNERKLIFKNKSTYRNHDSYIIFKDFLLNNNNVLDSNNNYNSDDLSNAFLNTDNCLGKIKLIVDYDLDYYYLKIK